MPDYDFRTLSPIDFEILVRDLLQENLGIRLESFKSGRDKGIDFRYCPSTDKTLIVQCKHYVESNFTTLLNVLKKSELAKISKLKPSKYILAVSIGLTPGQKDKICSVLSPYIHRTQDIYGRDDVNNLLGKYPQIERHTFKLWFASTSVLEEILNSKTMNLSRTRLEKMQLHAKYYVQNKSFHEAKKILEKHHYCIIAGIPGIGKSILAEMLCLHYIDQKYDVITIGSDISEAWSLEHTQQKRIYYYDDFLGQTALTEKFKKNEDQQLLDFIFTIRQSKTAKLILTTREYILNQAQLIYEKIAREKFDGETCVIDLSKYTRLNRAKILYNHIYFSDLALEYKMAILENANYLKIIDHHNFNPRIIDLMTDTSRIIHIKPEEYFAAFISNLDNPLEIWRHAFEEQLSDYSRHTLIVMLTMPIEMFLEDLKEAFIKYHEQQTEKYHLINKPSDFMHALKELEGNFTISERSEDKTILKFHNPSIKDYLICYLFSNPKVILDLINSTIYYDQVKAIWELQQSGPPELKQVIDKNYLMYLDALKRTINSDTCRLILYREGTRLYKDRLRDSYEARVIFVVNVVSAIMKPEYIQLFEEIFENVKNRVETGKAKRDDLSRLMILLKKNDLISVEKNRPLLNKIKEYMMRNMSWLEEFEPTCQYFETYSEIVSKEDKEYLISSFKQIADEVDYTPRSADDIRNDAYDIERISEMLEIDMTERVEELRDQAEEIEMNEEESEYDDESWRQTQSEYTSDNEIESIFNTLK